MKAVSTFTCSRCSQEWNGTSVAVIPHGWRVVRSRLLCADCLGARRKPVRPDASPRYAEVRALVVGSQTASCSFVQRKLLMPYNEAARCMEQLEREGIVSRPSNTGRRTVLLDNLRVTDLAA